MYKLYMKKFEVGGVSPPLFVIVSGSFFSGGGERGMKRCVKVNTTYYIR